MKYTILFYILILISCKGEKSDSTDDDRQIDHSEIKLVGKLFSIGSEIDSTKVITYGYCDCCTGELFFQTDSTFILADYCEASEDYFRGKYIINDSVIELIYDEKCFSRQYNWDQEVNENVPAYFYVNSKLEHINSEEISISHLKNIPVLSFENGKYYAIEGILEARKQFVEKIQTLNIPRELKRTPNDLVRTKWIRKMLPTNEIDTINFLTDSTAEIHLAEVGWTFDATYYFNSDTLVTEIISQQFEMDDVSELKPDLISHYILESGELEIVNHSVIRPNVTSPNVDEDLEYFRNFKRIK